MACVDNAPMTQPFSVAQPSRADIDASSGSTLLQFGTDWCGHCKAAAPAVAQALADHPGVHHVKVEDGPGRVLGRSFSVKLWPTLVFLHNGREVGRLVRPVTSGPISAMLDRLASSAR